MNADPKPKMQGKTQIHQSSTTELNSLLSLAIRQSI